MIETEEKTSTKFDKTKSVPSQCELKLSSVSRHVYCVCSNFTTI